MSRAKDWQIEQEGRGWWSVPGKYVCADCFDEEYLKRVVRDNAAVSTCSYCGLTGEEVTGEEGALIAAPLDSVMEVIAEGLQSEWNNADDEGIPFESAEGGYQARTLDSYDLVWEYACPSNEALAQDIADGLPDQAWVKRHYWSLSWSQALWYGWENFCRVVKHENRYMFHLHGRRRPLREPAGSEASGSAAAVPVKEPLPAEPAEAAQASDASADACDGAATPLDISFDNPPPDWDINEFEEAVVEANEGVSASRMLDAVGEAVEDVGLITKVPGGTKFYRARVGPASKPYRSARKLGPPPPRKAKASRMSPAGIPMFYGALEEHTAIAETVHGKLKKGTVASVRAFIATEEFLVLDLTNLKPIPSLFAAQPDLRQVLRFLHSFVQDLSKPIKKDDRVHIEYVPTQIVTEYFRHSFQGPDGQPVRGILYPSSRAPGGTACVLFFVREECGAPRRVAFFGARTKQWLQFVRKSAKAFDKKPRTPGPNVLRLT
jgi:hypothetical protein